ncbi:hypothetical protein B5V03_40715 [Bradyrhizobium betae]|uniref:Uncharacterized protein n=1 Tax=Bradyrhizobium betae TaxID=244734 RepID=A0A4V1P3G4_9BRAD|nr:hypothetical protein B5V03_40715 [Bradyrhizobium betae]
MSKGLPFHWQRWPDDVRLSDIEPRFVCGGCGSWGSEVRPGLAAASGLNLQPRALVSRTRILPGARRRQPT